MFTNVSPTGALIFKPRPSAAGRGFMIPGITLLVVALLLLLVVSHWIPVLFVYIFTPILLFLGLFFLGLGVFFWRSINSMRYEISSDTLTLVGGPVHYEIPLTSIKSITRRDIDTRASNRPNATATAVSTPSLSLANVTWKDTGLLKMVATSQGKNIMIIKTDSHNYGITPADDEAFLSALHDAGVPDEVTKPADSPEDEFAF